MEVKTSDKPNISPRASQSSKNCIECKKANSLLLKSEQRAVALEKRLDSEVYKNDAYSKDLEKTKEEITILKRELSRQETDARRVTTQMRQSLLSKESLFVALERKNHRKEQSTKELVMELENIGKLDHNAC